MAASPLKAAVAAAMAAIVLAACGATTPAGYSATPLLVSGRVDPSGAAHGGGAMHPDRGRSWMRLLSQARCSVQQVLPPCGLLYVSDYHDDDVIVYQNNQIVGKLTGFKGPDGVCSDKRGNVWIVNNLGAGVVEYAHGGQSPIAQLSDDNVYPLGCSVDTVTGKLAVTNVYALNGSPGSVAVYTNATGTPALYSDPNIYYMYFCGYDNQGNLFVDGRDTDGNFRFAELPKDGDTFTDITVSSTIYFPGNIRWDGHHIAVGDQEFGNQVASGIYRLTGATGHVAGTTVFDRAQDVVGFWIEAWFVIAPDANRNVVGLYRYPKAGSPTDKVKHFDGAYGVAISR
ncbi:MAG TPA: hypothetical protein VHR97_07095 [Candidatus Baltobacteraceae bacterium]|jgi:hypothetical protein|nr:hypothetical protein [Candidatus Baltobacteraceae bacterium]